MHTQVIIYVHYLPKMNGPNRQHLWSLGQLIIGADIDPRSGQVTKRLEAQSTNM